MSHLSIEAYLLINFLMDSLLLALALRGCGRPMTPRLFAGSALGTVYALVCTGPEAWLRSFVCRAAVMLAMLAIAGGRALFSLKALRNMLVTVLACAGAWQLALIGGDGYAGVLCHVAAAALLLCLRQNAAQLDISQLQVRIRLELGGRSAVFDAWIDTGNRLLEPLTGLPVLIVESRCVAGILPQSGFRTRHIPYGGLGGEGFLEAFQPDFVQCAASGGWRSVQPVWVAMYPGRISGQIHALAPPIFALRTVVGAQSIREER